MRIPSFCLTSALMLGSGLLFGCGGEVISETDAGTGSDTPSIDAGSDAGVVVDGGGADVPTTPDAGIDPLDVDDDGDGFSENAGDCNDEDDTVSPGAAEICDNGVDDDCDTVIDDVDGAVPVGPSPYLQASDGPWAEHAFENYVLADFEDQMLPEGVSATAFSWSSSFSLAVVDSVDGDDGDPTNGTCNPCEAMWSSGSITFTFDEAVLGALPTHVGVVFTDAGSADTTVTLSATSPCAALGELSSSVTFGDGSVGGETAEDRFVGIESPAGIQSVTVTAGGAAFEIDHLQFGW